MTVQFGGRERERERENSMFDVSMCTFSIVINPTVDNGLIRVKLG